MSAIAEKIDWLNETSATWEAYEPAVKTILSSTFIQQGGSGFLFDPIALEESLMVDLFNRLTSLHQTQSLFIVLTNANHERATLSAFINRLQIPVIVHEDALPFLELQPTQVLTGAEGIFQDTSWFRIPGAPPGEIALFFSSHGGTIVLGDSLINLTETGFTFLPDKYCENPARMHQSLQKLLGLPVTHLFMAHGTPLLQNVPTQLQILLKKKHNRFINL